MIVHVVTDPIISSSICPYPPTPQNSIFFYINDKISMQKEGSEKFTLQPRSVIVGPQLKRVSIDINRDHKAVRIGFHPGGLFRMLGIPLAEMIDESYDAEDVFGKELREVNEMLQNAPDFDSIHRIIETFLLNKLSGIKDHLPFDKAMLDILKYNGNMAIEEIASRAHLSLRQFERVSKDRIGLPPKLFSRLVRFSKAYRIRENNSLISWTDIAYECGYFDQMHMIRDFKQFAGVNPGMIMKELENTPVKMQAGLRI